MKNFNILIIFSFISQNILACAFSADPDFEAFCMFKPTLSAKRDWRPFYSSYSWFSRYNTGDIYISDRKRNVDEWRTAMQATNVPDRDIYELIYKLPVDDFLLNCRIKNWKMLEGNKFLNELLKPKNSDFMNLLKLAKYNESLCLQNQHPWGPDASYQSGIRDINHVELLEKELINTNNEFIRNRLAFLLLRYYYSVNNFDRITLIYLKYLHEKQTIVAAWGRQYYGFALWRSENKLNANEQFLECFDRCDEKKIRMIDAMDMSVVRQISKNGRTRRLRYLASVVLALRNPGPALNQIIEIWNMDPNSQYLPLLIGRELTKSENWILTYTILNGANGIYEDYERWIKYPDYDNNEQAYERRIADYDRINYFHDLQYLKKLNQFSLRYFPNSKAHKEIGRMMNAHMCILLGQFETANFLLRAGFAKNPELNQQRNVELLLLCLKQNQSLINERTQRKILNYLKDIESNDDKFEGLDESYYSFYNYDDTRDKLLPDILLYCRHEFEIRGDISTAWLFQRKFGLSIKDYEYYYSYIAYLDAKASPEDVAKVINWKNGDKLSPLQKWLTDSVSWPEISALIDLKGTLYLRQLKFESALSEFNRIPDQWYDTTYEFFQYLGESGITRDFAIPVSYRDTLLSVKNHSKRRLTQEIVDRLKILKNDASPPWKVYYDLGNAMHNLMWGRAKWMMTHFGLVGENTGKVNNYNRGLLYKTYKFNELLQNKAIKYFKTAYTGARRDKDYELAARSCIMLHVCSEPPFHSMKRNGEYKYSARDQPWLSKFKKDFSNTLVFELVSNYCW